MNRTRTLIRTGSLAIAVSVALGLLTGCAETEKPGNSHTYASIDAQTSCKKLQRDFDYFIAAAERHAGAEKFDVWMGYSKATTARMEKLGCA